MSKPILYGRGIPSIAEQLGITVEEAKDLIGSGFVGGGMLPKLNNCIDAVENGVSKVHILDGRIAHCILLEIFTKKGIGTVFVSTEQDR